MKQVIALLILTLCLIGCVSSNQVTGTNRYAQYAKINELGKEYRATITVQGDFLTTEYEGDYVTVGRDSVQWLDPETQLGRSAATMNLRLVRFSDRGAAAFDGGMVGGAIAGAFVLFLSAVYKGDTGPASGNGVPALTVVEFCGGGGLIGAGIGALIGKQTDYIFPAP